MMVEHLPVLPVLVPLVTAVILIFMRASVRSARRWVSLSGLVVQGAVLATLANTLSDQGAMAYALGNWPAPFGIALVLDHLSLWMLWVTWLLAAVALVYACRGGDGRTRQFHALFQFQLMGLNGAFLTADLFNLFVFFEVLLIASYTLLAHGGGADRIRASLHYVTLNLVGSSIFLIALGLLYAALGTLNLADMSVRIEEVSGQSATLARAAGYLLLVVFGLKAALVPVFAWLPRTYAAASGAVAALFVMMTKVGFYALLRVSALLFGAHAGELAGLLSAPLFIVAMLTLGLAVVGALAATHLMGLGAWMVLISSGTLLAAVALGGSAVLTGALYYLAHSTFAVAALFLLADYLRERCASGSDYFDQPALPAPGPVLGVFFLVIAVAVVGLPPLSGFFAKAQLLVGSVGHPWGVWYWSGVLVASFALLVVFSRVGSSLFWRRTDTTGRKVIRHDQAFVLVLAVLFGLVVVLSVGQHWLVTLADAAVTDLLDVQGYRARVLGLGEGA